MLTYKNIFLASITFHLRSHLIAIYRYSICIYTGIIAVGLAPIFIAYMEPLCQFV